MNSPYVRFRGPILPPAFFMLKLAAQASYCADISAIKAAAAAKNQVASQTPTPRQCQLRQKLEVVLVTEENAQLGTTNRSDRFILRANEFGRVYYSKYVNRCCRNSSYRKPRNKRRVKSVAALYSDVSVTHVRKVFEEAGKIKFQPMGLDEYLSSLEGEELSYLREIEEETPIDID